MTSIELTRFASQCEETHPSLHPDPKTGSSSKVSIVSVQKDPASCYHVTKIFFDSVSLFASLASQSVAERPTNHVDKVVISREMFTCQHDPRSSVNLYEKRRVDTLCIRVRRNTLVRSPGPESGLVVKSLHRLCPEIPLTGRLFITIQAPRNMPGFGLRCVV